MCVFSCLTTAPHWKKTALTAGGAGLGGGGLRKPLGHVNSGGAVVTRPGMKEGATPSPMDDCELISKCTVILCMLYITYTCTYYICFEDLYTHETFQNETEMQV